LQQIRFIESKTEAEPPTKPPSKPRRTRSPRSRAAADITAPSA
jgi:hypothetical protein